jgi:hypothetical protein
MKNITINNKDLKDLVKVQYDAMWHLLDKLCDEKGTFTLISKENEYGKFLSHQDASFYAIHLFVNDDDYTIYDNTTKLSK